MNIDSRVEILTRKTLLFLLDLLDTLNMRYWVDGGWGVDILAGKQNREHRDLDIDFDAEYLPVLLETLRTQGYEITTDWRSCRIELYHPEYSYLDIHPLQIAADGSAKQDDHHGGFFEFQPSYFTQAIFAGRRIPCISLEAQKLFHTGYEPHEKDLFDIQILQALSTISPCGDDCAKCPRSIAKSDEELKKFAELWHRVGWRDTVVSAEEMRCRGCTVDKNCAYGIRECQAKRSVGHCCECKEYPCRKFADVLAKSDFWECRCKEVCSAEEYAMLDGAFFHKKEKLGLPCSKPEKRELVSLKTPRLNLSPMQDDELRKMIAEQEIPELKQAFSEMLVGGLSNPEHRIWYVPWKICLKDAVIGELGFKGPPGNGGVEIGYGMNPGYEGRGFMTEAVQAAVDWALTQEGVDTVYAETSADNKASLRILEKLAFTLCGTGDEGPRFQKTKKMIRKK